MTNKTPSEDDDDDDIELDSEPESDLLPPETDDDKAEEKITFDARGFFQGTG